MSKDYHLVMGRKKVGRYPSTSLKQVTVRLSPGIVKAVSKAAAKWERTKSAVIEEALMRFPMVTGEMDENN